MTIEELDLIEKVYELKIKNKEELAAEILKKSREGHDMLFLCTIVNSWIAQNYKPGEIKVPVNIIRNLE